MSKEKIHMLHGAVGSYRDWSGIQESLERKGFLTDSHDLYKHLEEGGSSFGEFTSSFVQNLRSSEINNQKQNLIGYSLGGRLALHLLLEQPLLWNKAVIVSAHSGLAESAMIEREARIELDSGWAELSRNSGVSWSDFLAQWNRQGVLRLSSDQELGWSERNDLESVRNQISASFYSWSLGLQDDLLGRMSTLSVPILWVVGESDPKFLEIAKVAVSALPNAKLEVVKGAGHRVPWERPEKFHSLVSEWFGA